MTTCACGADLPVDCGADRADWLGERPARCLRNTVPTPAPVKAGTATAGVDEKPLRVRRRTLAGVRPRAVRFLVPGLVPLRTLTLFAGVGGLGKSTLALAYGAQLTRGDLPGVPASDVVIVSYEDTAEEILRPRLEAAGADLNRTHELYLEPDDGGLVVLPRHVADVELHVRETAAKLIVIDPIIAAIDVQLDSHKDQHVRSVLAQLVGICEQTDAAMIVIGHLNKAPTGEAYLRVAAVGAVLAEIRRARRDRGGGGCCLISLLAAKQEAREDEHSQDRDPSKLDHLRPFGGTH
jgi:hypothetical protein